MLCVLVTSGLLANALAANRGLAWNRLHRTGTLPHDPRARTHIGPNDTRMLLPQDEHIQNHDTSFLQESPLEPQPQKIKDRHSVGNRPLYGELVTTLLEVRDRMWDSANSSGPTQQLCLGVQPAMSSCRYGAPTLL
jgi:hypothetical protein